MVNKDLGIVTAYAYAVSKGYTGTEEEFAALMADYAEVGERAEAAATAAAASATAASGSASDSAASATAAAGSSTAASIAAGNASQAAQTATTKASEAAQSATQAAGSATTASTKASEAAQSALQAAGSATAAESAKTAAQTAQTAAETAQTAAETAQSAAEDAAESVSASAAQIAQNTEDISSVKNALQEIDNTLITDEASGAIATFADGADGYPMRSVEVSMEPIQDLHGQDAPYPAGGGKNLLPVPTVTSGNGITVTANGDGTFQLSGTATALYSNVSSAFTLQAGTYYFSGSIMSNQLYVVYSGTTTPIVEHTSGKMTANSFTIAEDTAVQLRVRVGNGDTVNGTIKPMISKTNDTTFAPYSNICPISGRQSVAVTRAGKNLLDPADAEIGIAWNGASNTARARLVVSIMPNTDYVLSMNGTNSLDGIYKTLSAVMPPTDIGPLTMPFSFNSGNNKYLVLGFTKSNIAQSDIDALKLQLELGSTATAYEVPSIQSITLQLGQTVYGGSDEVVSGTLTNNRASITLTDASQLFGFIQSAQGAYAIIASNGKVANASVEVICDRAVGVSFNNRTAVDYVNKLRCYVDSNGAVTIRANADSQASSASELFALFENAQIVYELASPVTVQLTAQQLTTLLGTNNVWSDGGDVSVEYVADTKAYIAKVIAAALA